MSEQTGVVTCNGAGLYYERCGTGPTVRFIAGTTATLMTTRFGHPYTLTQRTSLLEPLEREGRSPESFRVAKSLYLAIDEDEARAESRLRRWFESYQGNADLASRVCVWGPSGKVVDAVQAVIGAGAAMVLLNLVFDLPFHQQALADALGLAGGQSPYSWRSGPDRDVAWRALGAAQQETSHADHRPRRVPGDRDATRNPGPVPRQGGAGLHGRQPADQ